MSAVRHPISRCVRCGMTLSAAVAEGLCPSCLTRSVFSDAPDLPVGEATDAGQPERIGNYGLLEQISRGGMGIVYRARQVSLDREVAVKVLLDSAFASPAELARFRAEAAAAAALHHPNIVAVHEIGEDKGRQFFSMEFVAGKDLAELTRNGPLPARQAAELVAKVADAIQHAHDQGILHRDLKPSNVLVDGSGEPRITDFGLAKHIIQASRARSGTTATAEAIRPLTLTGQIMGTPGYMSPEQATARRDLGPATDIYSLGALLYQLVTGRAPFVGESPTAVLRQVEELDPVFPRLLNPAVPVDFETVCLKCLAKEPSCRYTSAHELAKDLRRFLAGEPVVARPTSTWHRTWRWCRRRPAVASLVAVVMLLLVVVVLGAVLSARRFQEDRRTEAGLRAEAEKRLREGEHLINFMLTDLAKQLEPVGRLDVLESTISEVDQFYSKVPPEMLTPESLRHRANALFQFGEIRSIQGRLPEARTNYDAAIAEYSRLTEAHPANLQWQHELTRAWNSLGIVFAMQRDFTNAAVALGRALEGRERLVSLQPANQTWLNGFAGTVQNLGQVQRHLGDLDRAEALLRQAVAVLVRCTEAEPESTVPKDSLAVVKGSLGQLLEARGRLDDAAREYSEKAEIHRELMRREPQNVSWQANLARGLGFLGALQNQQSNYAAAVATLNDAVHLHETLIVRDPANREWESCLIAELVDDATALRALRDFPAALVNLQRAWSLSETHAENARHYPTWLNNWRQSLEDGASLEHELAGQATAAGKSSEAEEHTRRAGDCLTRLQKLPKREP